MASTLNEESVEKKLMSVTNTQDSIQGLSLWIIHHRTHHERIVELWAKVIKKTVKPSHRLTLFYLCNDVVQNSKRKKAAMFIETFKKHLKNATVLVRDLSIKPKIERIFNIWEERQVYDKEFIGEIKSILDGKRVDAKVNETTTPSWPEHRDKSRVKSKEKNISPVNTEEFDAVQPADETLAVVEVLDKNKPKEKQIPSSEVLAEFKPQEMVEKIRVYKRLDAEAELKIRQLSHLKLDASSIEAIKQLKDRAHGNEFSTQFEESCQRLEDLVTSLEKKHQDEQDLLAMLTISEYFYDEQNREAKIVANAYKNFGARINTMKRRVDELKRSLPEPSSSLLLDAPSPGNTPPYFMPSNTQTLDMDLDSPSAALAADEEQDDVIPSPPDDAPSPVASPSTPTQDSKDLNSLENRIASIIPTLGRNKEQPIPVYTPQPLITTASISRRPSANKTLTEPEFPFPDEEGGSTPLTDERAATPVQDEEGAESLSPPPPPPPPKEKKKENPIDFLSKLISQSQKIKSTSGNSSSFLDSFTLMSSKLKENFSSSTTSNENDSDGGTSASGPKSWAAWKAQATETTDEVLTPRNVLDPNLAMPAPPIVTYAIPPPPPPVAMVASPMVSPPVSVVPPVSLVPPVPMVPPVVISPLITVPHSLMGPNPFFQHTSPGQKENWPESQVGLEAGNDSLQSSNIVYPPLQMDVPPPPFPVSKPVPVPIRGILRKTNHSVLKELTPSTEEMSGSSSQLPPPPPPPLQSTVSSLVTVISPGPTSVLADIKPPDQPPQVEGVLGKMGSASRVDAVEEFMEKLKRKTTGGSTPQAFVPNPVRSNLTTLTPGSFEDDGSADVDMHLDPEEEEEEEDGEEDSAQPKGIPVLSSVVRRVDPAEKHMMDKSRSNWDKDRGHERRESIGHEHSRDPRTSTFLRDRRQERNSADLFFSSSSSSVSYNYQDSSAYDYTLPQDNYYDPYTSSPSFITSDPYHAYSFGPTPPKRPFQKRDNRRRPDYRRV